MEKKKVILLRYGELFLKGKNRNLFEKRLIENIKKVLTDIEYKFIRTQNRYYIEDFDESLQDEIVERVRKVFGLHSLSKIAYGLSESKRSDSGFYADRRHV